MGEHVVRSEEIVAAIRQINEVADLKAYNGAVRKRIKELRALAAGELENGAIVSWTDDEGNEVRGELVHAGKRALVLVEEDGARRVERVDAEELTIEEDEEDEE